VAHYGTRSRIEDEFHHNLRGALAVKVYREMLDNEPIIGGARNVIEWAIRQVPWVVREASSRPMSVKAAYLLETCMEDMEMTWTEFISDALSQIWFGWAGFEKVLKVRSGPSADRSRNSAYDDGLLGWRGFFLRSQETLREWEWDDEDNVIGWWQQAVNQNAPVFLPAEKMVHFKLISNRGSPEGRSLLRSVYRPWYFMKRIQELEAIGIERDATGMIVLRLPLSYWDGDQTKRDKFDRMARLIKRNEYEGITFPSSQDREGKPTGFNIEQMASGGPRQISPREAIRGYQREIGINFNTQFQQLGSDGVGSNALSQDQTSMFRMGLGSVLASIRDTLNRDPVNEIQELNGIPVEDRAWIDFGDMEKPDLIGFANAMKTLVDATILTPDDKIERHVRDLFKLPVQDGKPDDEQADDMETDDAESLAEDSVGEVEEAPESEQEDAEESIGKMAVPADVRKIAASMLEKWHALPPGKRTKSVVALSRAKMLARGAIPESQVKAMKSFHGNTKSPKQGTLKHQQWLANGGEAGRKWVLG
jgi:hypothetical protein